MKIPIKAMSTNVLFTGRRFKTPAYRRYLRDLQLLLKPMEIPAGPLRLTITFGVSNARSDLDNCCKAFLDGLMARYGFDDSRIFSLMAHKVIAPKGGEFIEFRLDRAR